MMLFKRRTRSGVMLPCNDVVQENDDARWKFSAINPLRSIGIVGNHELYLLAKEVAEKLKSVLDRINAVKII